MNKPTSFIVINESGIRGDLFATYWNEKDTAALKAVCSSVDIKTLPPTRLMIGNQVFLTFPIIEPKLNKEQRNGEKPKPIDIVYDELSKWKKPEYMATAFGIAPNRQEAQEVAEGIADHFLKTGTCHFVLGVHMVDGRTRSHDAKAYNEIFPYIKECQGHGRHEYSLTVPDISKDEHPLFPGYMFAAIRMLGVKGGAASQGNPISADMLDDAWKRLEEEQNPKGGPRTYTWNGQEYPHPRCKEGSPQALPGRTMAEALLAIRAHRPDLTTKWADVEILAPLRMPQRNTATLSAMQDKRVHIPPRWAPGG